VRLHSQFGDTLRGLADPGDPEFGLAFEAGHAAIADHEHVQTASEAATAHLGDRVVILELQRVAAIWLDNPCERHFGREVQSPRVSAHRR
jgi:hypothetical protein